MKINTIKEVLKEFYNGNRSMVINFASGTDLNVGPHAAITVWDNDLALVIKDKDTSIYIDATFISDITINNI